VDDCTKAIVVHSQTVPGRQWFHAIPLMECSNAPTQWHDRTRLQASKHGCQQCRIENTEKLTLLEGNAFNTLVKDTHSRIDAMCLDE